MTHRTVALIVLVAGAVLALGATTATAQEGAPTAAAPSTPAGLGSTSTPSPGLASVCPDSPVQLVDALGRRARGLDEREASIHAREQAIADAQKKLDARLVDLESIRARITAQLDEADVERTARIAGLVAMVESNRPSSIAPMFAALDPELGVAVLDKMNRQKAGKLLAALPPARASLLATRMASPLQMSSAQPAPLPAAPAPLPAAPAAATPTATP